MAEVLAGLKVFFEFSSSGGIYIAKDIEKLQSNMIVALTTLYGERFFEPQRGSNFKTLLMEPNDVVVEEEIKQEITNTIEVSENRVSIEDIEISRDILTINILIRFKIIGFESTQTMVMEYISKGV